MTEESTKSRFVLPNFVDWFPYFFSLIPLLKLDQSQVVEVTIDNHPSGFPLIGHR